MGEDLSKLGQVSFGRLELSPVDPGEGRDAESHGQGPPLVAPTGTDYRLLTQGQAFLEVAGEDRGPPELHRRSGFVGDVPQPPINVDLGSGVVADGDMVPV